MKNPWAKVEKENKEFLKSVKKFISKHYGKRCEEVTGGCYVCQMYAIQDLLETHLGNR